eukprot:EG_transcript_14771
MDLYAALGKRLAEGDVDEIGFVVADPEGEGAARVASAFQDQVADGVRHTSKLGIAFWALPPLYQYALTTLRARDRSEPAIQRWGPPEVADALELTRALVLVNAECHTAWNVRKAVVRHHRRRWPPPAELAFLRLVLRKHPKSEEAWSHRFWVAKAQGLGSLTMADEVEVCSECCERYPRNYYAWSYRSSLAASMRDRPADLLADVDRVRAWVRSHVSDGSAYTYIQRLLLLLPEDVGWLEMQQQVAFAKDLLRPYRRHESLWVHKRWLAQQLARGNHFDELRAELRGVSDTLADVHAACHSGDPLVDGEAEAAAAAFALAYGRWLAEELHQHPTAPSPAALLHPDPGASEAAGPLAEAVEQLGADCPDWLAVRRALGALLQSHGAHYRTQGWWST